MSEQTGEPREFDVTPVTIEEEMRRSYLDYAMSVIVARAIPDVRDGLKPVHRRILYAMQEGGYDSGHPTRKASRIVGDVMGQYHPHGDSAIYEALVRMAQDFSMRLMLVDGQGNFGSMDGDPPAAMRYTEARLARAAESMLEDIDKDTVDFIANYDETTTEPTVLPAKFPNLLVNGAGGIAVGMATNIPTHNLGEVVDATLAYLDDPAISIEALTEIVPGPDFPTGGVIMGRAGIRAAYNTGRGSITVRGKAEIEEIRKDRSAIIVTEIPYQVNKARLVERIAELVHDKQIDGIAELRDESDRHGVRVVVELKRDAVPDVVLNQLYRFTPLQSSFGVNMLALNRGRPELMNVRQVIEAFCHFREEVITRRTIYELDRARERAHTLIGLAIAVANLDEMIRLIREAKDPAAAREQMLSRAWPAADVAPLIEMVDEPGRGVEDGEYRLSEAQAKAILELRLHRLTGLEREKINEDLRQLVERIADYLEILGSRERVIQIVRDELLEMKERFGDPRRTAIEDAEFEHDIEDLIQREDMVVTLTHGGYIKRVPLSTYRAQRRGGRGRAGMRTKEEDFVSQVFVLNTHTPVLFFSSRGMVYKLKVYKLPLGTPQARGRAMVNLLPLEQGEVITTVMPLPEDEESWGELYAMFATARGNVRRNRLSDFTSVYANGKIAMKLEEGDWLISVRTCAESQDVLLSTHAGKAIRFPVSDVRVFSGRTSVGVRGIALGKDDEVISMSVLSHVDVSVEERNAYLRAANALRRAGDDEDEAEPGPEGGEVALSDARFAELQAAEEFVLSVAEDGFGKRSSAYEYRVTGRGGKGVDNMDLRRGKRSAMVAAAFPVAESDQIMLVSDGGQLIRMPVKGIRIAGRATRGVTLFRLDEGERIVSVARLGEGGEDGDTGEGGDGGESAGDTGGVDNMDEGPGDA